MDNFINSAKQGYEAYSESQQGQHGQQQQGGQGYGNQPQDQQYNGGGQQQGGPQINHEHAINAAQEGSEGSGDRGLFSNALEFVNGQHSSGQTQQPLNEQHVQNAHDQAYNQGNGSSLDASSMGSAAALQALKSFGGGGSSQSALIGMAMSEASKLFDQSGGAANGGKQDVVNSAATTVMKLLVQSQMSSFTGGSNSGGLGSLVGLAGKFF